MGLEFDLQQRLQLQFLLKGLFPPGVQIAGDTMTNVCAALRRDIVSNVNGKLKKGHSAMDVLRATFPAGTLSGAPKIRAMEIIAEIEGEKRGPYGGAVGYFSFSGNMDTALILRTGIYKDGTMYVQAGGGIVADSNPEDEYLATQHKAGALMRAIDLAEGRG